LDNSPFKQPPLTPDELAAFQQARAALEEEKKEFARAVSSVLLNSETVNCDAGVALQDLLGLLCDMFPSHMLTSYSGFVRTDSDDPEEERAIDKHNRAFYAVRTIVLAHKKRINHGA
jgi:hypothetical protein